MPNPHVVYKSVLIVIIITYMASILTLTQCGQLSPISLLKTHCPTPHPTPSSFFTPPLLHQDLSPFQSCALTCQVWSVSFPWSPPGGYEVWRRVWSLGGANITRPVTIRIQFRETQPVSITRNDKFKKYKSTEKMTNLLWPVHDKYLGASELGLLVIWAL